MGWSDKVGRSHQTGSVYKGMIRLDLGISAGELGPKNIPDWTRAHDEQLGIAEMLDVV